MKTTAPAPLLSATARFVVASAVATVLALAAAGAESASHQAVMTAKDSFTNGPTRVALQRVEIVAHRTQGGASSL